MNCKQMIAKAKREIGEDYGYLVGQVDVELVLRDFPRGVKRMYCEEFLSFVSCVAKVLKGGCDGYVGRQDFLGRPNLTNPAGLIFFEKIEDVWLAECNGKWDRLLVCYDVTVCIEDAAILDAIYHGAVQPA